MNGAVGGMQSPLGAKIGDIADNSFEKAERIGQRVADIGADALEHAQPVKITRYEFAERMVRIPIANKGFEQAAPGQHLSRTQAVGGRPDHRAGGVDPAIGWRRARCSKSLWFQANFIPS